MEEIELIEKAKTGNKSALNTLLLNNYPKLKGYIIKMTGDEEESKDIIQETLLKAAININKFKPKAKFSTWLITIGTNVYRDKLRKNKRITYLNDDILSEKSNTEEDAIKNIEYKKVLNILQSLSYKQRTIFILKHFYSYKYEEIAQIMNCPIGTVRSRLHNCIKSIISEFESRDDI